jgi:hypothetical protein
MSKEICLLWLPIVFALFACAAVGEEKSPPRSSSEPIIIPKPWKEVFGGQVTLPGKVFFVLAQDETDATKESLTELAQKAGLEILPDMGKEEGVFVIRVVSAPAGIVEAPAVKKRVDAEWEGLPAEGYTLDVTTVPRPMAIICGKSPAARYYGVQSLRQMLVVRGKIVEASITDYPELPWRGMAMGVHWFRENGIAIKRLAALKCNYIYNTGSFLNLKFGGKNGNWRTPFTDEELETMKQYHASCQRYFVVPTLAFSPRGTPPTAYSKKEESDVITAKITQLFDLGFRNFAISFDDLQNINQEVLSDEADLKAYADIGDAHCDFVTRIYNHVKTLPGASLAIIPLWYGAFELNTALQMKYLDKLAKVPPEVDFVYCEQRVEGLRKFNASMHRARPPLIWDNFFAQFSDAGQRLSFAPPIDRSTEYASENLGGYLVLPSMPSLEDPGYSSWRTMSDYMWAPSRYRSGESLTRAVSAQVGRENADTYIGYAAFMREALRFVPDNSTKQARIDSLAGIIAKAKAWQAKMERSDPELKACIDNEINTLVENFAELQQETITKDFPLAVSRVKTAPVLDGEINGDQAWEGIPEITGFTNVKNGKAAENQTSFRIGCDSEFLYVAVVCREKEMASLKAEVTERDRGVFTDDAIELFIGSSPDPEAYFHIAVNTLGTVYDARHIKRSWFAACEKEWDAEVRTGVKKLGDCWQIEIRVPFKDLECQAPAAGTRWSFNVARERQVQPKEFTSYARLLKHGFHDPARFWTISFR